MSKVINLFEEKNNDNTFEEVLEKIKEISDDIDGFIFGCKLKNGEVATAMDNLSVQEQLMLMEEVKLHLTTKVIDEHIQDKYITPSGG